ncbi:hypothetical protein ACFFUB_02515 [Algimonas porphyrae]|uniref:hypothetical protein n=1 Tax=Algimonas porphyrae TaxID=1128113 RepID=UPI0024E102B2|nr:hypothetical protein [Algimonas porphyrae]
MDALTMTTQHSAQYLRTSAPADFSAQCRDHWPSARAMADGLSVHGIAIGERTCASYRSGETEPSFSLGRKIVQAMDDDLADRIARNRARSAQLRAML